MDVSYRHSIESKEPVEGFLVYGLEGLLVVLRTLFTSYPEKKAATLGRRVAGSLAYFSL
jgi:hypothetical protein